MNLDKDLRIRLLDKLEISLKIIGHSIRRRVIRRESDFSNEGILKILLK